jgi:AraC-like DNA-binding protein
MVQGASQLLELPYLTITEKIQAEYQLFELLSVLLKCRDGGFAIAKKNSSHIFNAREFLDSRPGRLVSIKELAKLVGLNEYKLKKEFKALTGKGIFEYQQERLMKEAHVLLREGMSITEVAEKTGYSSAGNFSNAFYKTFGFRPGLSQKS